METIRQKVYPDDLSNINVGQHNEAERIRIAKWGKKWIAQLGITDTHDQKKMRYLSSNERANGDMGTVSSMQGKYCSSGFCEKKGSRQSESAYFFKGMKIVSNTPKHPKINVQRLMLNHNPSYMPFLQTPDQRYNPLIDKPFYKRDLWLPKVSPTLIAGRDLQDHWDAMKNESRTKLPFLAMKKSF